ncbi:hypothetical protein BPAE_0177g00130 [Botrytis paeoniae]|uniref:Uncharacterized protein n=1 Tax=Botrytis paeoniae TaxID=278948 RepID=A0A4Z1FG06_9HELO|nr:hypothetical protein BPAE_0177g00130 [Botrytis paeoniae]
MLWNATTLTCEVELLRVLFRKISRELVQMQRNYDFHTAAVAMLGSLSWMAEEADEASINHQSSRVVQNL